MSNLYSRINNLSQSYYYEQAQERNDDILELQLEVDDFQESLINYLEKNQIDFDFNEIDDCVEMLQNWARNNENNQITFSINKF